jgi:hypothetical protein
MFGSLRDALRKIWRRSGEPPADIGPGALTPSRVGSDAPGGGGQPGSAVTPSTEPGPTGDEGRATGQ